MSYLQLSISCSDAEQQEVIIALLSEEGFESFTQEDDQILAFINEEKLVKIVDEIIDNLPFPELEYKTDTISDKNWNKLWEQNYEPVIVENRCLIRAPFHDIKEKYEMELIIEPQMSFGTAHHGTTYLMIQLMMDMEFNGKTVLDMGSGTGVLALLAALKGAVDVTAIDNNVWAYHNSKYNFELNHVKHIEVIEGDLDSIPGKEYDVILANINRNVLLDQIPTYHKYLKKGGFLLISGFLENDQKELKDMINDLDLSVITSLCRDEWIAMKIEK